MTFCRQLSNTLLPADPSKSLGADQREEQDVQRAMELSMTEMGPQESGVVHPRAVHFGPARQDVEYEATKWSLTTTAEIHLSPEPAERRHVPGEPRCLRPGPSAHSIAPFLTILHTIPLGREALLCHDHALQHYGYDDDWWNGASVTAPRIKHLDDGISLSGSEEIMYETQRLMAFLDGTERAYGSAEALGRLDHTSNDDADQVLGRYIQSWQDVVTQKTGSIAYSKVFLSVGVKLHTPTSEELGRQPFSVLDLQINHSMAQSAQTLYEAMDEMIWEGSLTSDETMAYLETVGDIFTVRVYRTDTRNGPRGIDIPAVWYPDRYLESSKDMAREMRAKKADVHRSIDRMEQLRTALTTYQPADARIGFDPRVLLRSTIEHLGRPQEADEEASSAEDDRAARSDTLDHEDGRSATVQQLKAIYESVMKKLQGVCIWQPLGDGV